MSDPTAEVLYYRIMLYHRKLGPIAEVRRVQERCRVTMMTLLGAEPSPEMASLAASLLG